MSSDTCLLSFDCLFACPGSQFLLVSWFPSLGFTESEDSSDLNSENLYQQQPVSISSLRVFLLCSMYCTLSSNSVYVQLANRASHLSCNRLFFRGVMTPYTHACKAQASNDCWTDLFECFIIIIITACRLVAGERSCAFISHDWCHL